MNRVVPAVIGIALFVLLVGAIGQGVLPMSADQGEETALAFEPVSEEWGLEYTATNGVIMTKAGGTYVSDVDNDGFSDVLLIGGRPPPSTLNRGDTKRDREPSSRVGIDPGVPVLAINRNGSFHYRVPDVPERLQGDRITGALFFDYDNDGWEDLLLLAPLNRPALLENQNGTFEHVPGVFSTEMGEPRGATTADFDRDGCLDLFVFQEGDWTERTPIGQQRPSEDVTDDNGGTNYLYRGDCAGGFERVTDADVAGNRWSLAASFVDFTGDGLPDVHVANDYNNDFLYVNRGNGTFRPVRLGAATDRNGMSSEVGDVDGDGRMDVFVTNIYFNRSTVTAETFRNYLDHRVSKRLRGNSLLVNALEGAFTDRAAAYGVQHGGWGWAAILTDFDNDGNRDLFHTTKQFSTDFFTEAASYVQFPAFFERTEDGFAPRNASTLGFEPTDGTGAARLDVDRDGDQDLLVGTFVPDSFELYENRGAEGNWLQVDVRPTDGSPAIGTRVTVTVDGQNRTQVYHARTDFLSQDSRVLHFGLGAHEEIDRLEIVRPDGTERTFTDLSVNARFVLEAGELHRDDPP